MASGRNGAAANVVAALVLSFAPLVAQAQHGTIVGRIVDSLTGEARRGAVVAIPAAALVATANEQGQFAIARVPVGNQTVQIRAIGYQAVVRRVVVRQADTTRIDVALSRDPMMMDAVRANAPFAEREFFEAKPDVGAVRITARAMESVPRIGEADVVRVVQLLPGVGAKNDYSTGFSVHGGETDQNLILLDGYPVYNPFHVGGLFSTFISSSVREIELLTGGFPAKFGGRLSSVLDVRSADERRSGLHGQSDVSVLAATTTLGGSFAGGKGSWTVAGRRTYADEVARIVGSDQYPYHFRDEQTHIVYELPRNTRLSVSFYDGRDILDGDFAQLADSAHEGANGGTFLVSWGNLVGGATFSKTLGRGARIPLLGIGLGDSAIVEQRVSTSRFSTSSDIGSSSSQFSNSLVDDRIGGSLTSFTRRHDRTVGYELAAYDIAYHAVNTKGAVNDLATQQHPSMGAAYFDDLWRAAPSVLVSTGARVETETGRRWSAVMPRMSFKYLPTANMAFTASAGEFSQSVHSLSLEDSPVRLFDLWRGSDERTPVSTAWQFVAGHERWLNGLRFVRVEAFYKRYSRLLEHNLHDDASVDGDEFVPADGVSYGYDVLLRQFESGPFSGWLSYTYTVNTRRQDSIRYAPANDRRHDFNAVGSWRIGRYIAGVRVGVGSGLPYTALIGALPRRIYDPIRSSWSSPSTRATFDELGGARNGDRLPATRRIDLLLQRNIEFRGTTFTPYLSIVNASNEKNVLFYTYDFTTTPGKRSTVTQFSILPSLGVSIAF